MLIEKEEWLKDEGYWKAELKPSLSGFSFTGKTWKLEQTHMVLNLNCAVFFLQDVGK